MKKLLLVLMLFPGLALATPTQYRTLELNYDATPIAGAIPRYSGTEWQHVTPTPTSTPTITPTPTPTPTPTVTDGWVSIPDSWSYASASTITVPSDATLRYAKGDRVRLTQDATVKYFYVVGVASTTLTVVGTTGTTVANSAISAISFSKSVSPAGFSPTFDYSTTHTGFSANPTYLYKYRIVGNRCTIDYVATANGTSNANTYTVTLPVTAATIASFVWQETGVGYDNGVYEGNILVNIGSAGTTAALTRASGATAWTTSGSKGATFHITYDF